MISLVKLTLTIALMVVLTSCSFPYLEIPRTTAVSALERIRDWQQEKLGGYTRAELIDKGVSGLESWGWGPQQPIKQSAPALIGEGEYLEILHILDAQIRDSEMIRRSDYEVYDSVPLLSSTLRLELIEDLDSLLLAGILRGYRRVIDSYTPQRQQSVLAVHTGDLIDLSLITEMVDAAAAVNYACNGPEDSSGTKENVLPRLPFLSVAGNHDGLTFGNIKDEDSTTWELGLNRLEFDLASMALFMRVWPDNVVAYNESVSSAMEDKTPLPGAPTFFARVNELRKASEVPYRDKSKTVVEAVPVAVKARINTPKDEEQALQAGYYALDRNGFRIIVLDTRSQSTHQGCVGMVQLGWFYRELAVS